MLLIINQNSIAILFPFIFERPLRFCNLWIFLYSVSLFGITISIYFALTNQQRNGVRDGEYRYVKRKRYLSVVLLNHNLDR